MLNTTWKLSLAALAAITIALTGTAAQAQLLVQEYWDFEDGTVGGTGASLGLVASTAATPDAGTGATYANDTSFAGGNLSASFPNEQDRFRVGDVTFLDGQSQFSLSAWVKPTAFNDRHFFITKDQSVEWGVQDEGGSMVFTLRINNQNPRNVGTADVLAALVDGQWHHVAATYDVTGADPAINYYVDGALFDTVAVANSPGLLLPQDAVEEMGFGDRPDDPADDQGYSGLMDEIAIYHGILSANQVAALANGTETPLTVSVPEPSSFLLAGLGVVGLAALARRRRLRSQK